MRKKENRFLVTVEGEGIAGFARVFNQGERGDVFVLLRRWLFGYCFNTTGEVVIRMSKIGEEQTVQETNPFGAPSLRSRLDGVE